MKDKKQIATLIGALPLFSRTAPHVLAAWLTDCAPTYETAVAGSDLSARNRSHLGLLLEGRAEIHSADNGRTVVLRTMNAPGVFGAASLFCEGELPLSRIEAKTACQVLYVPLDAVRRLLAEDEGFREAYLTFLAGRVCFLNRKIQCFTAGSAERRLALWLLSEEDQTVTLPASLSTLADMLDIGRASLYRALDKLEGDGLIRRNGREITVLSQDDILKKYQ